MRFITLKSSWTLAAALLLTACHVPVTPVTAPATHPHEGLTLRVRPVVNDGVAVMASVPKLTAADIDTLDVFLEVKVDETFVPVDAVSGQPSAGTSKPVKLRVDAPLDPDLALSFTHLKPNSTYRIVARAYKGEQVISDAAASQVEVSVGTNTSLDPISLPVKVVTPFTARTQVEVALWGAFPLADRLQVSLKHPVRGLVASLSVPKSSLGKPLALTSLNADTSYTLDVQAFASGNPTPIGTASTVIPVADDPEVASRSVSLDLKGSWSVHYMAQYLDVDSAGNLYLTVPNFGQTAADIIRYGRDGSVTTTHVPIRVDGIAVMPDGTRYLLGVPGSPGNTQVVRLLSDAGDYEILPLNYVNSMAKDAAGNLYVSSGWEIVKFAPGASTGTVAANLNRVAYGLVPRGDGSFYFWSWDGFYQSTGDTKLADYSNVGGAVIADDGTLLIATRANGIRKVDPITKGDTEYRPHQGFPTTLIRDTRGLTYFVTQGLAEVF